MPDHFFKKHFFVVALVIGVSVLLSQPAEAKVTVDAVSAKVSGNMVNLSWKGGSVDTFKIRRSTTGYPAGHTSGTAVSTVSCSGIKMYYYSDTSMSDGIYYYNIFGMFSSSMGNSKALVVMDNSSPNIRASKSAINGSTINLSWPTVSSWPGTSTGYFLLKRQKNSETSTTIDYNLSSSTLSTSNASLEDGSYVYTVYLITPGANASTGTCYYGRTAAITIDTTPPQTPTLSAILSPSNNRAISLSFAIPATTAKFMLTKSYNSGTDEIVSSNISPSTSALIQSGLKNGVYLYSLYAIDSYGNTSNVGLATCVTINESVPTSPTINSSKSSINGSTVSLSWTVPEGTSTFLLKRNGDLVSSNIASTTTTFSQTGLSDGDYIYTIFAIDSFANTSNVGTAAGITIDTTSPSTPEITATKSSINGNGVSLSWNAPSGTSKFLLKRNGSIVSSNMASTTTSFSQSGLSDGAYVYTIYAIDSFANTSNVGTSSPLIIDTTATDVPVLTTHKPSLNGAHIVLDWTVPTSAVKLVLKQTYNGDESVVSSNISISRTRLTKTGLSDGSYLFSLSAIDEFGNTSNARITETTIIDTQAPDSPRISATKRSLNGRTINLTWNTPTGTDRFILKRRKNSEPVDTIDDTLSSSTRSFRQDNVADGRYVFTIYAVDAFSNISPVGTTDELIIDGTAPITPNITAEKTAARTITLSWTKPISTETFVLKRIKNNGLLETVEASLPSSTTTIAQSELPDGDYVYKVYALDSLSNTSNAGISSKIIISTPTSPPPVHRDEVVVVPDVPSIPTPDVVIPEPELIADTTPPDSPTVFQAVANESTVTLSWTNPSDAVSIILKRMISSVSLEGTMITQNVRIHSYTLRGLSDGTLHYGIFAKDESGNISAIARASVTVDTKPTLAKLISRKGFEKGQVTITKNMTTPVIAQEIGSNTSRATLNIGAVYKSEGTKLGVGTGSIGHILITSKNATWTDAGNVKIGSNGGAGTVVQSDGAVEISGRLQLGSDDSSSGNYVLSGGVLKTSILEIGSTSGSGTFQWTGGRLQTTAVAGNLNNQGGTLVIDSDSPISITGNYTQSGSSSVAFSLKATNGALVRSTGILADAKPLLTTTGETHLEGTISISISGYSPKPGDKIYLVNRSNARSLRLNGMHLNSDVNFDLPSLDSRLSWDTTAFETEGTLSIIGSGSDLLSDRPLNFPNPFKLSVGTTIGYWLNDDADIDLRIYTSTGSEVYQKSLLSGVDDGAKSGYTKIRIGKDELGSNCPSGVYGPVVKKPIKSRFLRVRKI